MTNAEHWIEAAESCEREAARLLEGAKQWRENAANGVPHRETTLNVYLSADELQRRRDATLLSADCIGT